MTFAAGGPSLSGSTLFQHCVHCGRPSPHGLPGISQQAWVLYFRCDSCGAVWSVPKDDLAATPHMVTTPASTSAS